MTDDLPENEIIDTIQKLIAEHKLDVSSKNEFNQTLLFHASLNAQIHVVQFLLDNGASKNIEEKDILYHWTALMAAAIYGNAKIVQILLNYGADMTAQDFMKRTAFQHSLEHNNTDAIHCFLNLMSQEELDAFSKASEDNGLLFENFNKAVFKNYFILRQFFEKEITLHITKENNLNMFQGFPELIVQIRHLQLLAEAPNNEAFDPWYAMSFRIKQHASLLQSNKIGIAKVIFDHNPQNISEITPTLPVEDNLGITPLLYICLLCH